MGDSERLFSGGTPTEFQHRIMSGVAELAEHNGYERPVFRYNDAGRSYYEASASLGGRAYELEIYDDVAYAQAGQSRYESGVFDHLNKGAEAEDFLRRIERLISTGSWFGVEDPGLAESILNAVKRLVRWW